MKKVIPLLLILMGLVLLLIPTITDRIIIHYSDNVDKEEITADKIEENNKRI
mgnify:CR=1 FL=1